MKVISVVGARPQFVKLAPVANALTSAGHEHVIIHTGQHYDHNMSEALFTDLNIPAPNINLRIGSGSHGVQTGLMLAGIEDALRSHRSDWVLVYGDTNSTLAGSLAAAKLHRRVAHLEAGLRSLNRRMPEEINRVATDHLSDLLLAPTQTAADHLKNEGLSERTVVTGDVMTDVCLSLSATIGSRLPALPITVDPRHPFVIATIHRPENTDDPSRLERILKALGQIPRQVVLAAHPRLRAKAEEANLDVESFGVHISDPFSYSEMIAAIKASTSVVTDSGGMQKEAYILGVPCTTVRPETEWPETLVDQWNIIDANPDAIPTHATRPIPTVQPRPAYGSGNASENVIHALESWA